MIAEFTPSTARGTVTAPPSKSAAHREIICACLAHGKSTVSNIDYSQDILATIDCMRALGAEIIKKENSLEITGPAAFKKAALLPCRESGSTLRFLIPLSLIFCGEAEFTGSEKLMSRPLSVYEEIFETHGISIRKSETSVKISGELKSGKYTVPGNISSQFISGLLFAMPLLEGDSEIKIIPPVESRPYIDMTLDSLARHSVKAGFISDNVIEIKGGQRYTAADTVTEGDWSNAAFFSAFNLTGGDVTVTGLDSESSQADKVYTDIFKALKEENSVTDLSSCPDLGPVCMALAFKHGALFTGTKRLILKESDRCAAMASELFEFGIRTETGDDYFRIFPGEIHAPSKTLSGHNDHRIVMALSVLCSITGGKIDGAQAVSKSLPDFFERLKSLGIKVKLYETA